VVEPGQEQGQQGEDAVTYTILQCDQRSDEWHAARAGRFTGSCAADAMRTIKSGAFGAGRKHLRTRLALERITGKPQERKFTTEAVQNGIDKEPVALGRYEAETGEILTRVGFLSHNEVLAGCSLDAAIMTGDRIVGIVEGKCPESATHFEYLRTREIPSDYRWQCLHNIWVSGAEWCDFISFDDRFPEDLQYLCVRLQPDAKEIRAYEIAALRFLAEVTEEVDAVNKLRAAA
jgi:YqaJ-like recombinase protein